MDVLIVTSISLLNLPKERRPGAHAAVPSLRVVEDVEAGYAEEEG
jgi:hypothetical protein